MEHKTFKNIVGDLFKDEGFAKKGNSYYYLTPEIIVVIGLQKSNYTKSAYYINIGYIINQLNPTLKNPRFEDGDIRSRFSIQEEGKEIDHFDIEKLKDSDVPKLRVCLKGNIRKYVEPITSIEKLKLFLKENPVLLYQTTRKAKDFLGFL